MVFAFGSAADNRAHMDLKPFGVAQGADAATTSMQVGDGRQVPVSRIRFHLEKAYVGAVGKTPLRSASLTSVDKSACISRLWFLNYGGQLRIVLEGDEKSFGKYIPCPEKVSGYANHYVASTTQQVADVFKALVGKCEIPEEARKVFDFPSTPRVATV